MDESLVSDRRKESFESENAIRLKSSLFSRLCPLLVIRLLPLKIFDNLGSSTLYGVFRNEENWKGMLLLHFPLFPVSWFLDDLLVIILT